VYNFCDYSSKKRTAFLIQADYHWLAEQIKKRRYITLTSMEHSHWKKCSLKRKKNILKVIKIFFTPIKKGPVSELFTESVFGEPTNSFYMALIKKKSLFEPLFSRVHVYCIYIFCMSTYANY